MMKFNTVLPAFFPYALWQFRSLISGLLFVMITLHAEAHNGSITYAYPVDFITIDGDLSDWPSVFTRNPLAYYQYGAKSKNDRDNQAFFYVGYNVEQQALYVAVELIDDDYVKSPDNPVWNLHDMQVLYIDAKHSESGSGVVAYEYCEYVRKIVEQENLTWYPQVAEASWDNVESGIRRNGEKTTYEWKIILADKIAAGKILGFDYVIFDKDENQDSRQISWGQIDGPRHLNNKSLGDLVLLDQNQPLALLEGQIQWKNKVRSKMPDRIRFISDKDEQFWLQTQIDSLGKYALQIPEGSYRVSIPQRLVVNREEVYKTGGEQITQLKVFANNNKMQVHQIVEFPKPDLLPSQGILHDFDDGKAVFLDKFIDQYREYYGIPGVSLALIKDGNVAYHQTYGWQNSISKVPVHENSLFEAASITKPVFAFIVMRLVERGIIDLDKPLHEYLPFDELEGSPDYKLMTGRHVLVHQSGLPNWGRELKNTPGTQYGYSGEGFEYLKRVVEKITAKNMNTIINEELITPLKLYNFHFSDNPDLRKVATSGHHDEVPTIQYWPQEPGMAWSMFTEAKAFSRFALALLHRKELQESTYEKMLQIYTEFPLEEGETKREYATGMGLGIGVRDRPYGKVFSHGGNNGDFKCYFEVFDELKMGFIIFTNSNHGDLLHSDLSALLIEGNTIKTP